MASGQAPESVSCHRLVIDRAWSSTGAGMNFPSPGCSQRPGMLTWVHERPLARTRPF